MLKGFRNFASRACVEGKFWLRFKPFTRPAGWPAGQGDAEVKHGPAGAPFRLEAAVPQLLAERLLRRQLVARPLLVGVVQDGRLSSDLGAAQAAFGDEPGDEVLFAPVAVGRRLHL